MTNKEVVEKVITDLHMLNQRVFELEARKNRAEDKLRRIRDGVRNTYEAKDYFEFGLVEGVPE